MEDENSFCATFLNISCQTTLEIEDKKLELAGQSGEANKKKAKYRLGIDF